MVLPLARWWAAEHRVMRATLHDKRDVAHKRGQFLAVVPPSVGELSSWPKRLERPPSIVWL
jgi:hypothetical protein